MTRAPFPWYPQDYNAEALILIWGDKAACHKEYCPRSLRAALGLVLDRSAVYHLGEAEIAVLREILENTAKDHREVGSWAS